jgi:transposase
VVGGQRIKGIESAEPLPPAIEHDFRVSMDQRGHYHFCIPCTVSDDLLLDVHENVRALRIPMPTGRDIGYHKVVSIDPGVRTPWTCYLADGWVIEWGGGDRKTLDQAMCAVGRLRWRIAEAKNNQQRRRRKKALVRAHKRVHNLVDDLHKKFCNWLCENFKVIVIPKFNVGQMVAREDPATGRRRTLGKKTVVEMLALGHYSFRQRLIQRAQLYPDCTVIECDERYTSKTCGHCGQLHRNLGGNKTFTCNPTAASGKAGCGYVADRDASAARNILLRFLTLNNIQPLFSDSSASAIEVDASSAVLPIGALDQENGACHSHHCGGEPQVSIVAEDSHARTARKV